MVLLWLLLILQIFSFSTADDNQAGEDTGKGMKDLEKTERNFHRAELETQKSATRVIIYKNKVTSRIQESRGTSYPERSAKKVSLEVRGRRISLGADGSPLRKPLFDRVESNPSNLLPDVDDIDVDEDDYDDNGDELVYTVFDYDDELNERNFSTLG